MTNETHHHHDDHCTCGHDHEHHHHDEHCTCGHDHEHHHHDEHCTCGHDHEHHHHDEHCDCGHDHHEPGEICTQVRTHDDARVVSGHLELNGDYGVIRVRLRRALEEFAAQVAALGGVVGHIKASVEHSQVEMFSITDEDVMIKTAPEERIVITLAAIVFYISEEQAEHLAFHALEHTRDA